MYDIDRRIVAFLGNFGTGKSEVAVNFALEAAREAAAVGEPPPVIVDLDVVNPYFRCREAVDVLEAAGVEVVYPSGEYAWADLPIVLPRMRSVLEDPGAGRVILDVGGDDLGAKVLASLSDVLPPDDLEMVAVINAKRPFTETESGTLEVMRRIEESAGRRFTSLVSNTHLVEQTDADTVMEGVRLVRSLSNDSGLPVRFVAVMRDVAIRHGLDEKVVGYRLFLMERRLPPPWLGGASSNVPGGAPAADGNG